MKSYQNFKAALAVVSVALASVCGLVGCSKEQPPEPSSPASYMHDEKFRAALDQREQARRALMKRHAEVREKYNEMKAKFPTSRKTAALKAEMEACEREFEQNRRETQDFVRERLRAPAKQK